MRELDYLRQTGASTSTAKEVKLLGLHGFLIGRYRELAAAMQRENAAFALRRAASGALLAALGSVGYYAAYAFPAWRAVAGGLTVGDLTFLAASFLRLRGCWRDCWQGYRRWPARHCICKICSRLDVRVRPSFRYPTGWRSRPPSPAGSNSRTLAFATRTPQHGRCGI